LAIVALTALSAMALAGPWADLGSIGLSATKAPEPRLEALAQPAARITNQTTFGMHGAQWALSKPPA